MSKGRKAPELPPVDVGDIVVELRQAGQGASDGVGKLLLTAAAVIEHLKAKIAPQLDAKGMVQFSVTSGYGARTRLPFVEVNYAGQVTQMSPEGARALALNLLGAAEAAEADGAIWQAMLAMEAEPTTIAALVEAIRAQRERRRGKEAVSA